MACSEFVCSGFGKLFDYEGMEFCKKGPVALGFGFPFVDGRVNSAETFYGNFEEGKATMEIRRNDKLLKLLFNVVITFKFGGRIFSRILCTIHAADEFWDVNVVEDSAI